MPSSCQLTTQSSPPTRPGICSQADTARSHKEGGRVGRWGGRVRTSGAFHCKEQEDVSKSLKMAFCSLGKASHIPTNDPALKQERVRKGKRSFIKNPQNVS